MTYTQEKVSFARHFLFQIFPNEYHNKHLEKSLGMTNGITKKRNLATFVGIIMEEKAVQQQVQKIY